MEIEVPSVWIVKSRTGDVLRRIRILAMYPEKKERYDGEQRWLYEEELAMFSGGGHIGRIKEHNLTAIFEPLEEAGD